LIKCDPFNQNYHKCFETNLSQINFKHSIKEEIKVQEFMLRIDQDSYGVSSSKNAQQTHHQKDATLYTDRFDGFLSSFSYSGSE
jgi:hypothetical protein